MMKKAVVFILTVCFLISAAVSFFGCSVTLGPVPNVMGSDHADAKKTLEDAGFEVVAVEVDAGAILSETKWDRTVKKGEVFKVNDVTCPDFSETPSVKEGKVRIYFAKEDYILEAVDSARNK